MARIIAVRHAESVANTKGIYQGQTYDTDLSLLGKKQALALAKTLYKHKVQKIFVSPLKRTMQTAKPIIELSGAKVVIAKELIETNHGLWEGKDKDWIRNNYQEIYKKWLTFPYGTAFPDGESFIDTVGRVKEFIMKRDWNGTNLFVTHDNIVRIIVCLACGSAINNMWKIIIEPAAINTFYIKGINGIKKLEVVEINLTNHIETFRANTTTHAL
jgi:probable phosphoglycerate mutase